MLRVTPIYGSRWCPDGQAEEPSCTLIEYGGCKVLCNVGWCGSTPVVEPSSSSTDAAAAAATVAEDGSTTATTALSVTKGMMDPRSAVEKNEASTTAAAIFPDLPSHDCLLISDSTLQAVGGLPLYYKQMVEKAKQEGYADAESMVPPIYATFPTVKMGQMTLYDQHAAISLDGGRPPFSLEDLDTVFHKVHSIKYSQAVTVYHPETGQPSLSITAHRAGHVVGGAFYVLQRLQDETIVVWTDNYHIAKELHLDSSTLLKYGSSPDVLITKPGGPALKLLRSLAHPNPNTNNKPALPPVLVTQAERNLVETVLSVLRRDGNVLLPVDASGRVLELLLLLDRTWERQRLSSTYHLVWLGPMVTNTLDFCRSQLEWMATTLGHQFDSQQGHPYALKQIKMLSSTRELDSLLSTDPNPTCVLASGLSLEGGPARDVLLKWADNPDHSVVFTDSSQCYLRRQNINQLRKLQQRDAVAEQSTSNALTTPMDVDDATEIAPGEKEKSRRDAANATETSGSAAVVEDDDDDGVGGNAESSAVVALASGEVGGSPSMVSEWTTASQLFSAWFQAKYHGHEMDDSITVDVKVPHRAPLAGAELQAFLASEEEARKKQKEQEEKLAMLREVELAKGQLRLGEQEGATSSSGGGGAAGSAGGTSSGAGAGGGTTATSEAKSGGTAATRPRKKSRFDATLFLKYSKPQHLTFDYREEAVGIGQSDSTAKYGIGESVGRSGEVLEDDYGIAVQSERFTDIVSGVDPSKFAGGSGRLGDDVLRRGLGFGGVDGRRPSKGGKGGGAASGRVSDDEDQDSMDELADEQAVEAVDLAEGHGIIRGRNGRAPIKVGTVIRKLEVLAEIAYVPLEGRVDARAARQSVRALQPRRVVVLGGPRHNSVEKSTLVDEVTLLAEAAVSFATEKKTILTPSDGETAELDVGHSAYAVRLIDAPFQTREEKEAGKEPPLPEEIYETKLGACTVSLVDFVATGQKVALDGSLVLAPRQTPLDDSPRIYLSDGEVLLTDLRAELIAAGLKAEYSAKTGYSQLVVNGKIVVKKANDSGKIDVEGPLCEDFYTVRSVVCGQFVTL